MLFKIIDEIKLGTLPHLLHEQFFQLLNNCVQVEFAGIYTESAPPQCLNIKHVFDAYCHY